MSLRSVEWWGRIRKPTDKPIEMDVVDMPLYPFIMGFIFGFLLGLYYTV